MWTYWLIDQYPNWLSDLVIIWLIINWQIDKLVGWYF